MVNFLHIAEGWGKSLGWLDVSPENQQLSIERMRKCARCPFAKQSSFLKLLKGEAREMDAIYCTKCGCPTNEKTLVTNEKCPIGEW